MRKRRGKNAIVEKEEERGNKNQSKTGRGKDEEKLRRVSVRCD